MFVEYFQDNFKLYNFFWEIDCEIIYIINSSL